MHSDVRRQLLQLCLHACAGAVWPYARRTAAAAERPGLWRACTVKAPSRPALRLSQGKHCSMSVHCKVYAVALQSQSCHGAVMLAGVASRAPSESDPWVCQAEQSSNAWVVPGGQLCFLCSMQPFFHDVLCSHVPVTTYFHYTFVSSSRPQLAIAAQQAHVCRSRRGYTVSG